LSKTYLKAIPVDVDFETLRSNPHPQYPLNLLQVFVLLAE
jgi:hypothetical protein